MLEADRVIGVCSRCRLAGMRALEDARSFPRFLGKILGWAKASLKQPVAIDR
jgi:hypothetical protein